MDGDRAATQRLAHAEAAARRWKRNLEVCARSDACDEIFSVVLRNSLAADLAVERLLDQDRDEELSA